MAGIRSLTLHRGAWLAAGVAMSVGVGAAFAGVGAGAASDPEEATFVPIVPCRLVDTRPAEQFNVGPRDTPLGPADTHVQQVTGANGACTIPADATGVALNVTAVEPTAASYFTAFPSDAARPTVSNLNFLPGSPPTPNKVDVRLSADGQVSFFNLAGEVHLVADVAGYYTAAGLQELSAALAGKANTSDVYTQAEVDAALAGKANAADVYTQAEVDAALAGKANAADVHTQAEVDAALAGKADTADVYTQAEVDAALAAKANTADVYTQAEVEARTQPRTLTFPASALNLPDPPGITTDEFGLTWAYDDDPTVHIAVARPSDWTGDSPVTLRIFFTRTPNAGDVRFRIGARSFDPGDDTDTVVLAADTAPQSALGQNIAREASIAIQAGSLDESWWDISITRRADAPLTDYLDPIFVRAVALEYEATT
jgi:hypothetical protein